MNNFDNTLQIVTLANYILDNQTTIRATAKEFNIPKSTVHHNLSKKLRYIDYTLYLEVKKLMDKNFSIKHINGGQSTKIKYEKLKNLINQNDQVDAIGL